MYKLKVSPYADLLIATIYILGQFLPLAISSPIEFLEGQPTKVTCTASYTCPHHLPTIRWNYDNMETSSHTTKAEKTLFRSVSTLTFIASAEDNGRSLTCNAQFTDGPTQEQSVTLRIKSKFDHFHFTNKLHCPRAYILFIV